MKDDLHEGNAQRIARARRIAARFRRASFPAPRGGWYGFRFGFKLAMMFFAAAAASCYFN